MCCPGWTRTTDIHIQSVTFYRWTTGQLYVFKFVVVPAGLEPAESSGYEPAALTIKLRDLDLFCRRVNCRDILFNEINEFFKFNAYEYFIRPTHIFNHIWNKSCPFYFFDFNVISILYLFN